MTFFLAVSLIKNSSLNLTYSSRNRKYNNSPTLNHNFFITSPHTITEPIFASYQLVLR